MAKKIYHPKNRNPHYSVKGGMNFSYIQSDAIISSGPDPDDPKRKKGVNAPQFEEVVRSYNIRRYQKDGQYRVYEVYRKGQKPKRRATIKSKKGEKLTMTQAIAKFKSKKPHFRQKITYKRTDYPDFTGTKTYQDYAPRPRKTGKVQMQLLVYIEHIKKPEYNGTYVGYSATHYWGASDTGLDEAFDEALKHCYGQFYGEYSHLPKNSGNLTHEVMAKRYITYSYRQKADYADDNEHFRRK
jgi:hypothetical protein